MIIISPIFGSIAVEMLLYQIELYEQYTAGRKTNQQSPDYLIKWKGKRYILIKHNLFFYENQKQSLFFIMLQNSDN